MSAIGWADPREQPGELLWPERFGVAEIADLKRTLGSYAAAGQLQQRPSPAGGGIIKRHWFQPYEVLPSRGDRMIMSWDMAFKGTGSSDYVVGQVWAKAGANFYLLEQVRERLDFTGTLTAFERMVSRWPRATAKYVEDKANGPAVISALSNRIPGIIAVNPKSSKEARVHAITPLLEAGNVHIPNPARHPWVNGLMEECAAFPNGAHDDQVDAMTQAILQLTAWAFCGERSIGFVA